MKGAPAGVMIDPWSAGYRNLDFRSFETDVVLRSKPPGSKEPILVKRSGPIVYARPQGGDPRLWSIPVPGADMIASFYLTEFRAMPPGDVEVVVYATDSGEHRCKIDDKERKALR